MDVFPWRYCPNPFALPSVHVAKDADATTLVFKKVPIKKIPVLWTGIFLIGTLNLKY